MMITRTYRIVVLEVSFPKDSTEIDLDASSSCSESHKDGKEKVKECES